MTSKIQSGKKNQRFTNTQIVPNFCSALQKDTMLQTNDKSLNKTIGQKRIALESLKLVIDHKIVEIQMVEL